MSSDELSDAKEIVDLTVQPPRKTVAFKNPIDNAEGPGTITKTTSESDITAPLAAALEAKAQYIATLHLGLRSFLDKFADESLKTYAAYFRSDAKHKEMSLADSPVPASVRKIRLTLQPLEEVKESEDFKALQTKLYAETETLQWNWAKEYALAVDKWNCEVLLRRFYALVCHILREAARGFIAQLNIALEYNKNTAVINMLALHQNELQ